MEFQKKYQGRGFVVIGVSMDSDGWKSVKPWLKERKVNYPVVIGSDDLGKQYGLEGMPLTALIDRDGKIADVHPGLVNKNATEQQLRALLQQSAKYSANSNTGAVHSHRSVSRLLPSVSICQIPHRCRSQLFPKHGYKRTRAAITRLQSRRRHFFSGGQ